jgi:cytochrome c5
VVLFASRQPKWVIVGLLAVLIVAPFLGVIGAKIYQTLDDDPDRGAVAIADGAYMESYGVPEYLDQGWDEADSLWFYNTTQGSGLLPYDFLLVLEQPDLNKVECERNGETAGWFLCDNYVDGFRYLPQQATLFNPDALPVGFVKESYQGQDYVGYTCAACHTGQINYTNPGEDTTRALRIDGGPAMADMVGFLTKLVRSMKLTQKDSELDRLVKRVLALNNDYSTRAEVEADLKKWTDVLILYNTINDTMYFTEDKVTKVKTSHRVQYGNARLDAFGRIYNRVIQHAINRDQVAVELALVTDEVGEPLLTDEEIHNVVYGDDDNPDDALGELILRDGDFAKITDRLRSDADGYPGLKGNRINLVRDVIFNPPNAPVSYPFLWDITRSDYVQWNGLASNAAAGPIGRNAGEVIGVFGILDWQEDKRWLTRLTGFSLSAVLSGQKQKDKHIRFKSSIDLFNLQRLESHLGRLKSPLWPFCRNGDNYYLPKSTVDETVDNRGCRSGDARIDEASSGRGKFIYAKFCQSCHDVVIRDAWDRLIVSNMTKISKAGTDPAMAKNSVNYTGKSGNFKDTYQRVSVGKVVVKEETPVVQILTAATAGVVGTPDPDKWFPRRIVEYLYALVMTLFDNQIQASVKSGNYDPDTTAKPYNSLLSYRARSLNGIWATAPYLHNGSVPTLYDLLLPVKCKEGTGDGKFRPTTFKVGARTFDPKKVGFKSEGYDGFTFDTTIRGNSNAGHVYGACRMTDEERWDLIEYLKSLDAPQQKDGE